MALRMVALNQLKNGQFHSRKVIPIDVREGYALLFGVSREAQLRQPADTPRSVAKTCHAEWIAEVETRIETLRAQKNGEGQPLTKLNALALAGRWYSWYVKQHEDDPGSVRRWRDLGDQLIWDVLYPHAPDSYHEDPKADPHWEWAKEPEVREAVRPQIAEEARTARFLANEGLVLNKEAHARFVDAVSDHLYAAITLLQRRAASDYSPDPTPETFPPFITGAVALAAGPGCWELFEAYVKATQPADSTVSRWRAVFLQMQREFSEKGATGITEDDARAWINGLVSGERTGITVREVWLSSSRRVFGWALQNKRIKQNPFKEVKVDVRRKVRNRETKAFRPEEVQLILRAALTYEEPKSPRDRTRRWVPWLCAYSGARAGEVTQLRGVDVQQRGTIHAMLVTPEAGTTKTGKARLVPLHEHIIAQGFLDFVRQMGNGPLFYRPDKTANAKADPLKPKRSRASTARAHLSDWVRELGVTDPEVKPTHAWRHTFKQRASRVGITAIVHHEITGHEQASEGDKYSVPTFEDMAEELKKFPRYKLN